MLEMEEQRQKKKSHKCFTQRGPPQDFKCNGQPPWLSFHLTTISCFLSQTVLLSNQWTLQDCYPYSSCVDKNVVIPLQVIIHIHVSIYIMYTYMHILTCTCMHHACIIHVHALMHVLYVHLHVDINVIIAKHLSTRQLILHRISCR